MRNDDAIHLVGHLRGAAHFPSPLVVSGGAYSTVFSDRLLPSFFYFPKLPGTCLVVRFLAVLIFGVIDSLLSPTRSGVVRVERQYPVIRFHRLVVLAGLIIAVGFGEQALDLLNLVNEAGIHCFVEVTRPAQICDELLRLTAVRIVTVYDFTQDRFRPGVIALRDTRFGQDGAALANSVRRFIVRSPGNHGVRQIGYGRLKFLERDGVIPRPQGGFATGKRGFSCRYSRLTSLHFAVGNALGVLREGGCR